MTGSAANGGLGADFGERTEFYTFAPESLGKLLPEYEILREVGKGSMGIVYEARRRADGRHVAIKLLPPSLTLTETTLARFIREAQLMQRVEHPSIAKVLDLGRRARLSFFVMDFVDGIDLERRLAVGPLPVGEAAAIGSAVARALHYAHERRVVHRDVKPGNLILREDGRVVITDFGLARESGSGSMTESGAIVGTPMYMAPEQVLGDRKAVGSRSDVYSLGATLYTLVTGRPPFVGPTAQSVLKQVLEERPARPKTLRADVPRDLEAIILHAMDRDPALRYGSAAELADDLDRFGRGEPVRAHLPGVAARAWRRIGERPLLPTLCLVIALLAIGAVVLQRDRARNALEAELAGAERTLALASRSLDELGRRVPTEERTSLLFSAVAQASAVIAAAPDYWRPWFVRAKARHQLRSWTDAIADLDEAERRHGGPTAELLHYRIDARGQLHDVASQQAQFADLHLLLDLDPSSQNRCIVAGEMLTLAATIEEPQRLQLLATVERVLGASAVDDPHDAVVRARLHELRGDIDAALRTIHAASEAFAGDPIVHAAAAAMFRRLGRDAEGDAAAARARTLDPRFEELPSPPTAPQGIDLREFQVFAEGLEGLLRGTGQQR